MRDRTAALLLLSHGALFGACANTSPAGDSDAGRTEPFGMVCAQAEHQRMQCVEPGQIVQGSALPATFDHDGCQLRQEVKNSCCNPAQAGPRLISGQCCYVFCDDSCC